MNETEKTINLAVGIRIRQARIMLGFSQQQLATQLDITFQQVQKYEKGINNVNASRLLAIARILGVTVSYLVGESEGIDNMAVPPTRKFMHLIQAYQQLEKEPAIFNALYNVIVVLAKKYVTNKHNF